MSEQIMLVTNNRGMIKYRTCFSSISHHGYKLDVLKSGMQKYLRRRELDKMIWCALEIFKFELWANNEKERKMCKGIITNMLNRIIVMMDEELLFIEVERYLVLRNLIEKFDNDRKNGMKWLVYICHCLNDAKLSRHASDIRAYWDYRFRFDSKNAEYQKIYDKERLDKYGEKIDDYHYEQFLECFKKNDDGMYFWMFKIFNGGRKSKKSVFRKKRENINKIWKMLFDLEFVHYQKYNKGLVKKLLEYKFDEFNKNKKRGERFMFLVNCIELVRGGPCRFFINEVYYNDLKEMYCGEKDERNALSVYWTKSCEYMQIDDYVIDMHTSQGRKMGKNRKDFAEEGCVVIDENMEFLKREWREYYINEKILNPIRNKKKRWEGKKKVEEKKEKVEEEVAEIMLTLTPKKKEVKKSREEIRSEKYKRIKKMRGKPKFDDLEKNLDSLFHSPVKSGIKLCSDKTCGNKVMCFEYQGKIWKESRKSMNYNRDYCVVDECKELFGLKKIGMKRVLADFRIEKIDKSKKSWTDNWHKVIIGKDEERVVYCVMNKITHCNWKIPMELKAIKHSIKYCAKDAGHFIGQTRTMLKEFIKIGVFRGIFRCSDFNCRNVLVGLKDQLSPQYLVSIDEGDIGKRLDILGGREKWLVKALNKDKTIIKEIMSELISVEVPFVKSMEFIGEKMKEYKFSDELIKEVAKNFKNLVADLKSEGVEF